MYRTFSLSVLCVIVLNAKNYVVLSSSTVDLVSVLRRDLMKNNEDFQDYPRLPPAAAADIPALPTRRADFLQPNKLLQLDEGTENTPETFTFQIQSWSPASTTPFSPGSRGGGVANSKAKKKKSTFAASSIKTERTSEVSSEVSSDRPMFSEVSSDRPMFSNDFTDQQRLRFNSALKQQLQWDKKNKQKYSDTSRTKSQTFPHHDLLTLALSSIPSKVKDMKATTKREIARKAKVNSPKVTWSRNLLRKDSKELIYSDAEYTPNPQLLDLAPATGYYIQKLRGNNRVCDRNVLRMEGPKYHNSPGNQHEKYDEQQKPLFENTHPPKYILPRCCNCCRKSLLGCE